MKKGFTLIELVVATAILAMMLGFTAIIFKVSIKSSRMANAHAEIIQKFNAITNQIDSDLTGIHKNMPLLIYFEQQDTTAGDPNRFDQMMCFAGGHFYSTQIYDSGQPLTPDEEQVQTRSSNEIIEGFDARIYYGHQKDASSSQPSERLLCRRRHILISDPAIDRWPNYTNTTGVPDLTNFDGIDDGYFYNDLYEHDSMQLKNWEDLEEDVFRRDNSGVVDVVFTNRPELKIGTPDMYHNLLSENVVSFKIQWAYWNDDQFDPDDNELRWFPSDDPGATGSNQDSHFKNKDKFGVYFNIKNSSSNGFTDDNGINWYPIGNSNIIYDYKNAHNKEFDENFYPKALKFTFKIIDSKKIIKDGKTFTHVVYIGD